MKIYVVMSGEWEDEAVDIVYLSEQKAQEYCHEMNLLLPKDDPDRCIVITWVTADDDPIVKTQYAQVMSYDCKTINSIEYAYEPQKPNVDSEGLLTFTIDVSTCKNYGEVMELAEETLEKLKESGEF